MHSLPSASTQIKQYVPKGIHIVSQGELVANSLQDYLKRHPEMDARCTRGGTCTYFTTEAEEKFADSASTFLNESIQVSHLDLND